MISALSTSWLRLCNLCPQPVVSARCEFPAPLRCFNIPGKTYAQKREEPIWVMLMGENITREDHRRLISAIAGDSH